MKILLSEQRYLVPICIYFRQALPSIPKYYLPPSFPLMQYPYFCTKNLQGVECDSDSLTCGDECDDVVDAGSCHAVDRHASAVHRSSIPPIQGWRRSWGIGRALAVPPGEETDYNSHQQCQNTSTCHSASATPGRPLLPTGTQCAANVENNALHTFPQHQTWQNQGGRQELEIGVACREKCL